MPPVPKKTAAPKPTWSPKDVKPAPEPKKKKPAVAASPAPAEPPAAPPAPTVAAPAPAEPSAAVDAKPRRKKTRRRPTAIENGPHKIDLHVGGRVRLARLLAGRTQQWLAERVKLTFQQIQKYERGANRVSCSMLSEFAQALDRPVGWFFSDAENGLPEQPLSIEIVERQRLTYELVAGFTRLPDEAMREHLVALTRSIADAEQRKGEEAGES